MEESEWGEFESTPLDEPLVALIEQALSNVHPNARARCDVDTIHRAFRTLGCFSVADLQLFLASDLLILQASLAPTPLTFLMQLKQCAASTGITCVNGKPVGHSSAPGGCVRGNQATTSLYALMSHREASLSRHLVAILKKCVDSPIDRYNYSQISESVVGSKKL